MALESVAGNEAHCPPDLLQTQLLKFGTIPDFRLMAHSVVEHPSLPVAAGPDDREISVFRWTTFCDRSSLTASSLRRTRTLSRE
jgi:hypothetical protein